MLAHATSGGQRRLEDEKALHVPVGDRPVVRLDVLDVEVRPLRLDGEPPHGGIGGEELGPADRQGWGRLAPPAPRPRPRGSPPALQEETPAARVAVALPPSPTAPPCPA